MGKSKEKKNCKFLVFRMIFIVYYLFFLGQITKRALSMYGRWVRLLTGP